MHTHHWLLKFHDAVYEVFTSSANGLPVRVSRHGGNATFFAFDASPAAVAPDAFVPETAATVPCAPLGG